MQFELHARDGAARAGRVTTLHGAFATPAFMPVGTYGTVKAMTPAQLTELGAQIVLANTFHLLLRPGDETVASLGGLHGFMNWPGSDPHRFGRLSGMEPRRVAQDQRRRRAFQIADQRRSGIPVAGAVDAGAAQSRRRHRDGVRRMHGASGDARASARVDGALGAMGGAQPVRARRQFRSALFGIVQGGMYSDLRRESLERLVALGFDGYAVGGLSVGESKEEMAAVLDALLPRMPHDRPRYLMGVGTPADLVAAVATRRRHVRLRVADAQCAQWLSVHVARRS